MLMRKRACQCGSGRYASDCCGRFRRLTPTEIANAYLSRQARQAREVIGPFSQAAVATLQAEAATLPDRCDLFTETLLASPAAVIRQVQRRADTAPVRVAVAKAVIALREAGTLDEHLAAAALVDLTRPQSALCTAALAAATRDRAPSPTRARPVTV